jgi:hypothetical protein
MRKILLCLIIGLITSQSFAQTRGIAICGNEYQDGLNEQVAALLQANRTTSTTGVVYKIPVVFHILTDQPSGVSNISDCIIQNQITILNNCFRRKTGAPNTNAAGADAEIEFYLARKNNSGAAISGINRVNTANCNYTTVNSTTQISNIRGAVSASTNWPNNKYLNIFVLKTMPNSNRVRGQAWYGGGNMGVFVHYSYVGSKNSGCPNVTYIDITGFKAYDLGMTVVHEVGHYLNLLHTFDNCTPGDGCTDTPPVTGVPNPLCGTDNNTKGLCSGATSRQWQNYLDYTDDACMDRFTSCQVTRMRNVLTSNSQYTNIVSSTNFTATGGDIATSVRNINGATTPTLQVYPNPFSKEILINLENKNQSVSYQITNIFGQSVQTGQLLRNQKSLNLGHLSPGVYFIKANNETIKIIKQ